MRLRFQDLIFDSDTREAVCGAESLAVSPRAFVLLELLTLQSPKALSKAETRPTPLQGGDRSTDSD